MSTRSPNRGCGGSFSPPASRMTPIGIWHILGNMFALFVFGRDIEARYGSREFLARVFGDAGVCQRRLVVVTKLSGVPANMDPSILGASVAIAGVIGSLCFQLSRHNVPALLCFSCACLAVGPWTRCRLRHLRGHGRTPGRTSHSPPTWPVRCLPSFTIRADGTFPAMERQPLPLAEVSVPRQAPPASSHPQGRAASRSQQRGRSHSRGKSTARAKPASRQGAADARSRSISRGSQRKGDPPGHGR